MDRADLIAINDAMKSLYGDLRGGDVKRDLADSLANIAGKQLKAFQLHLADRIFEDQLANRSVGKVLDAAQALTHTA